MHNGAAYLSADVRNDLFWGKYLPAAHPAERIINANLPDLSSAGSWFVGRTAVFGRVLANGTKPFSDIGGVNPNWRRTLRPDGRKIFMLGRGCRRTNLLDMELCQLQFGTPAGQRGEDPGSGNHTNKDVEPWTNGGVDCLVIRPMGIAMTLALSSSLPDTGTDAAVRSAPRRSLRISGF